MEPLATLWYIKYTKLFYSLLFVLYIYGEARLHNSPKSRVSEGIVLADDVENSVFNAGFQTANRLAVYFFIPTKSTNGIYSVFGS